MLVDWVRGSGGAGALLGAEGQAGAQMEQLLLEHRHVVKDREQLCYFSTMSIA